eukprot:363377-Chlamydomonas_euryale.AAC.9
MREHLRLLHPPAATINMHVWRVMCVAALNAMDASRRYIWAMHRAHPTPGLPPGQTVLPYAAIVPAPMGAHAGAAARRAVAALHANLHSFVMRTTCPLRTWRQRGQRMH